MTVQTSRLPVQTAGVLSVAQILVIHGPNLNLLGSREPAIYGRHSLAEIDTMLAELAEQAGHDLQSFQSNAEHELVGRVQAAANDGSAFILINPAAFTHTSVALRDALAASAVPFIEVHLSNPHAREAFRRQSYFSDLAVGVVAGFGADSYRYALDAAIRRLHTHPHSHPDLPPRTEGD
jgi:3-dehydroquinate dehydratase-2